MNFPLFVDLKDKKVLIVGAGAIAARRATVLVEFGAKVTVVAPEEGSGVRVNDAAQRQSPATARDSVSARNVGIADERTEQHVQSGKCDVDEKSPWECQTVPVRELAEAGSLVWKQHAFGEQDLEELAHSFLVIAATSAPAVNDHIVQLCHERHIPVNHAGDQSQCDFQFPAIVQKAPVVIGVNANGKNHGLVKRVAAGLREWLEKGGCFLDERYADS